MLDNLFPAWVPYPIKGGILRGIRTALAAILAGVVAAVGDGSLFNLVHIIPPAYSPVFTMAATTFLVGVDKFLRERGLLEDAKDAGLVAPNAKEIPLEVKPEAIEVSGADSTDVSINVDDSPALPDEEDKV